MGKTSITKLLVVAVLIILVFGIKRLRMLGGGPGSAIRGLEKTMNEDDDSAKKITVEEEALVQKISHKEQLIRCVPPEECRQNGEEAVTSIVAAFVVFGNATQKRRNELLRKREIEEAEEAEEAEGGRCGEEVRSGKNGSYFTSIPLTCRSTR